MIENNVMVGIWKYWSKAGVPLKSRDNTEKYYWADFLILISGRLDNF